MRDVSPIISFSAPAEFERRFVRPKAGRTLIVGSFVTEGKPDRRALYPAALGVDMRAGPGVDRVANMEQRHELGQFEHVECMSVLEHTRRPWVVAENIERVMVPGATLFFSVPFIWRVHSYPGDFWRMTTDAVRSVFQNIEWETLLYGDIKLHEGLKVPSMKRNDHPYMARCEVLGFGIRV